MVLFLVKHKTNKIFRLCFLMAQTHFLEQYHLWLSCKDNKQEGGYAPKSIEPQQYTLQNWVHMLRNGGAPGAVLPFSLAPGW